MASQMQGAATGLICFFVPVSWWFYFRCDNVTWGHEPHDTFCFGGMQLVIENANGFSSKSQPNREC